MKGGNYLEALAQAGIVVFDKTGTLTKGTFEVTAVHPQQVGEGELLELAALAERFSDHPISRSIQAACQSAPDPNRVTDAKEMLRMREWLENTLAKHTGQDVEKIRKDIEVDTFLTAQEAKDYDIVDEVLEHRS